MRTRLKSLNYPSIYFRTGSIYPFGACIENIYFYLHAIYRCLISTSQMNVSGLVKAVARDLYNQNADIMVVNKTQTVIAGGKTQEHVTFKVTLNTLENSKSKAVKEFNPSFPNGFHLSAEHLCQAFPYHIVFDSNLCIRQSGLMIQRFMTSVSNGKKVTEVFELIHPRIEMTMSNIKTFINAVFMLKMKTSRLHKNGEPIYLILKGKIFTIFLFDYFQKYF